MLSFPRHSKYVIPWQRFTHQGFYVIFTHAADAEGAVTQTVEDEEWSVSGISTELQSAQVKSVIADYFRAFPELATTRERSSGNEGQPSRL